MDSADQRPGRPATGAEVIGPHCAIVGEVQDRSSAPRFRAGSHPLRGRRAELGALDDALAAAALGPVVVAVIGGAGIGKSRLVDAFAAARRSQHLVREVACVPFGGEHVLLPVLTALDPIPAGTVPTMLVEAYRRLHEMAQAQPPDRPMILVIEDVHWADSSTLALVGMLCRGVAPLRLLTVVTCRDDPSAGPAVHTALREWDGLGAERIRLAGLPLDELVQVVAEAAAPGTPTGVLRRAAALARGNPFHAIQLGESIGSGLLSDVLRDHLLRPVLELDEPARRFVQLLAVLGAEPAPGTLVAAWGGSPTDLARAGEQARRLGLVTGPGHGDWRFTHALLQEAVLEHIGPGELRQLRREAAEAVERVTESTHEAPRAALAAHAYLARLWELAGDPARAHRHRARAGHAATALGAFDVAHSLLLRVLADTEQDPGLADDLAAIHRDLGAAAHGLGLDDAAVRHGEWALAALDPTTGPVDVLRASTDLAEYQWARTRTRTDEVEADLRKVLARLPSGEPRLEVRVLALLARICGDSGRLTDAQELAERAARLSDGLDDPVTESSVRNINGAVQVHLGRVDAGLNDLYRALFLARRAALPGPIASTSRDLVLALNRCGRIRDAVEVSRAALDEGRARGAPQADLELLALLHIDSLIDLGRWTDASTHIDRVVAFRPSDSTAVSLTLLRAVIDVRRGRTAAAARALDEIRVRYPSNRELEPALVLLAAETAVVDGQIHRVRQALASSEHELLRPGVQLDCTVAMALRAEADHRRAADYDPLAQRVALARVDGLAELAGRSEVPYRRAMMLMADAERTRLDGSAGDPAAWSDTLLAWLQLTEAPYETAYCRVRLALALAVDPADHGRAAALVDEADRVAGELGASAVIALVASARERLALPGAAALSTLQPPDPVYRLTAREREVLLLLSTGLTNRRIARTLSISEKTVGHHISQLFVKLGVTNRVEAANRVRPVDSVAG